MKGSEHTGKQEVPLLLDELQAMHVTFNPETSARAPPPHLATADEVERVADMLGRLQVEPAKLEPKQGNWAYRKTLPDPDDLPSPMTSHIWEGLPSTPQSTDEDSDEDSISAEDHALISHLVSGSPLPSTSHSHDTIGIMAIT